MVAAELIDCQRSAADHEEIQIAVDAGRREGRSVERRCLGVTAQKVARIMSVTAMIWSRGNSSLPGDPRVPPNIMTLAFAIMTLAFAPLS